MVLDDENSWDNILASTLFASRDTVHITTQYTATLLIFGRDSIINQNHDVDWEIIRKRKQDLLNKDNERENHNLIKCKYKQGDKVLFQNTWKTKFNQNVY